MKEPFFTLDWWQVASSSEHELLDLANAQVAPLLERLSRYEMVEQAAKELNERLKTERDELSQLCDEWEDDLLWRKLEIKALRVLLEQARKHVPESRYRQENPLLEQIEEALK